MIRHSCRIISRKNTRTLYIHVWCSLFNISPSRQRRMESDAEDRCRYGRCRRNHSRKMPFRSKFCYISNSSYIYIAVPGVPLSDVSADDESGFFLFTNLIHFSDYAAFVACCPCLYPYDYAAGGLFFDAATTVCRRNYSSVPRRLLQTELFFCAGDNPCCDSQIHPLKSGITARKRS